MESFHPAQILRRFQTWDCKIKGHVNVRNESEKHQQERQEIKLYFCVTFKNCATQTIHTHAHFSFKYNVYIFFLNRPLEVRRSMEALHMPSSPTHSKGPSLPSPPCTSLLARWATPSTTTCATPSSPWYAAACLSELPPSFIQSKWV